MKENKFKWIISFINAFLLSLFFAIFVCLILKDDNLILELWFCWVSIIILGTYFIRSCIFVYDFFKKMQADILEIKNNLKNKKL